MRLIKELNNWAPHLNTPSKRKRKAAELYVETSEHDALFTDHTEGSLEAFLNVFLDPRGIWMEVVRETDQRIVGSAYFTAIIPRFDADGHFTVWDSIASGREEVFLRTGKWLMDRYDLHRITAEVPVYQSGTLRFTTEKLGFVEEGERREAAYYKGEWVNTKLLSILRDELTDRLKEVQDG